MAEIDVSNLIDGKIDISNLADNVNVDLTDIIPEIVSSLPQPLIDKIGALVVLFKTIGILLIIYIFYLFIRAIFDIKRYRRIKRIEQKVDLLLGNKGIAIKGDDSERKFKKKDRKKK